ncbi:hypothetical protein FACS1894164_20820 [Spirochaetia bacterium]|nr:hypothetical protein FACS1894164_20820 [Spirochaetia bacterium]
MKKLLKGSVVLMVALSCVVMACASNPEPEPEPQPVNRVVQPESQEKLYAEVLGFNEALTPKFDGYNLLDPASKTSLEEAIDGLPSGGNTAAYYAMDVALDRLEAVQSELMKNDPLSKYYVVFFTDGLDNISRSVAEANGRKSYDSLTAYGDVLQSRMRQIVKSPSGTFQSYVLLYRGADLQASGYTEAELNTKLSVFTGAQNITPVPKIIQADNFPELQKEFEQAFPTSSFSFVIPKGYAGSRVRMQLSGRPNDQNEIYFEGDFRATTTSAGTTYYFENIACSTGFSLDVPASKRIEASTDSNIESSEYSVTFFVNALKLFSASKSGNYPYRVDTSLVTQWFYDEGSPRPRLNSEYQQGTESKKNAYILLIMDTSTSLEDKVIDAKNAAKAIINYITEQL